MTVMLLNNNSYCYYYITLKDNDKSPFLCWEQDLTLQEFSFITNQTQLPFSKGKQEASVQLINYCKKLCMSGEVLTACLQWDLDAATSLYDAMEPNLIFTPVQEKLVFI